MHVIISVLGLMVIINMNNKKIILIVIFVAIVLIGGGFWFINNNFINKDNRVISNIDYPIVTDAVELAFVNSLSEADKNIIKSSNDYNNMIKHQNMCNAFLEDSKRNKCLSDVELRQAFLINNSDLCTGLIAQDDCFKTFAINNLDSQLCYSINDSSKEQACLDLIVKQKALAQNNISLCGNINDDTLKNYCFIEIINTNDISFCDTDFITNNNMTEQCRNIILAQQDN